MRLRWIVVGVALLALVSAPPVHVAAQYREPPDMAALVQAAAKEGVLDVAWGETYGGADGVREIEAHIDRIYHIGLRIHYAPVANGAAFEQQVAQEVRAGHPASSDVLFHVRDPALAAVAQPVDYSKYLPKLVPNSMYFEHRAVVVATSLVSFIYNTRLVPPAAVPRGFADLLKPEWKGKIASSSYQGLFGDYLGLNVMMGHDGMLSFYRQFSQQVSGLITCSGIDRVASGEFLIFGLDCGDHMTRLAQRKGAPLGIIHPREGTAIYAFAPGVPLTAAHPAAARLFIAYLLTPDGQKVLWDVMAGDNASFPGSRMARIIADERRRGVRFVNTFGLAVKHPEVETYTTEINAIMNQGR